MNAIDEEIRIAADTIYLPGSLVVPARVKGLVLFAHGSGSSRFSPRNQQVAQFLNDEGFGTLLFDLLDEAEHRQDQRTAKLRFDIPLLAGRLVHAVNHVRSDARVGHLSIGLFGASTGAAAALIAAAESPHAVNAVVSRGGRPDLAGDALARVRAPVLLVVGGLDTPVIDLNRRAAAQLNTEHRTVVVPGASHLFEEPGKIEEVENLARDWFGQWLARVPEAAS